MFCSFVLDDEDLEDEEEAEEEEVGDGHDIDLCSSQQGATGDIYDVIDEDDVSAL